jgi:hypothetical protein
MAAIIDSAPSCVTHVEKTNADDLSDFILQANYQDCAGFMTFGPGTTWGDGGAAAATGYYVLIWVGAAVMVAAFVLWIIVENRRLVTFAGLRRGDTPPDAGVTSEGM